jgi:hypothetical protein
VSRYVVNSEKAGIPGVGLTFADQVTFFRNIALISGVPEVRRVDVPRVGTGPERVAQFIDEMLKALTDPLTDKEQESGLYVPPPPSRIIFEGTLDDAQAFFQQTTPVSTCGNCPIAKYTDGLPIIIPTEEKVREMLTGTSHAPEEELNRYTYSAATGQYTRATSPVTFAGGYSATVEKVAIVAVMAGCKPEYMPVVLAVAATGGGSTNCPGTSGPSGQGFVVSGPIAKEIGMNPGQNALDVGNPANLTIGRSANLVTICFGQCITGAVRSDAGHPINGIATAEDEQAIPSGWETLREESGYKLTDSVLGKITGTHFTGLQEYGFAPSSFRGLIGEGYGGMARRIGVEGTPGPHNFLEYILPMLIPLHLGGVCMLMHPNMAKSLYDYGFKKKADVYQWMWDTYWVTIADWEKHGWYDFHTSAGTRTEPTSGIPWKDLPDNYLIRAFGSSPTANCLIVGNGFADENCWVFGTDSSPTGSGRPGLTPIDPWR